MHIGFTPCRAHRPHLRDHTPYHSLIGSSLIHLRPAVLPFRHVLDERGVSAPHERLQGWTFQADLPRLWARRQPSVVSVLRWLTGWLATAMHAPLQR